MNIIKIEAEKILKETKITTLLSGFGKIEYEGSYVYDVMYNRDIDLRLVLNEISYNMRAEISAALLKIAQVQKLEIVDLVNFGIKKEGRPDGIWFGITLISDENKIWNIDLWAVDYEIEDSELVKQMKNLTEAQKNTIIQLKKEANENGVYKKGASSVDIYNSVLNNNIKNFEEYIKASELN